MPLTLPQLDDRTWKDLVEEAHAMIPSLSPEWTDFNASDPGITLVELFAYLTETLLYRVDRVSEPSRRAFLKLIDGPGHRTHLDLVSDTRDTLAGLRQCHRAVTAHDFESLAMTVNELGESQEKVARAHCLPRRNLEDGTADQEMPGHVSVLIVPATGSRPSDELLRRVRRILEPARLITTRVHVVAPRFVTVNVRITLVIQKDAVPEKVRAEARAALEHYFDPLEGGADGLGWQFGRDVYVSEIYQILSNLAGLKYITRTVDRATQRSLDELVVGPADHTRLIRNRSGELEAIDLHPDELVSAQLDPAGLEVRYNV
jgi:Baseplate J-like protein